MPIDIRDRGWLGSRQSDSLPVRSAVQVSNLLDLWSERRRQRRALLVLSDHMLKDIGIGRGEAYREGRKPFWRG